MSRHDPSGLGLAAGLIADFADPSPKGASGIAARIACRAALRCLDESTVENRKPGTLNSTPIEGRCQPTGRWREYCLVRQMFYRASAFVGKNAAILPEV